MWFQYIFQNWEEKNRFLGLRVKYEVPLYDMLNTENKDFDETQNFKNLT